MTPTPASLEQTAGRAGRAAGAGSAPRPSSASSSRRRHPGRTDLPKGQKPSARVRAHPRARWGGGRGPGDETGPASWRVPPSVGWGPHRQGETWRGGASSSSQRVAWRADLCGLHRPLPEGQAGAVVPPGVDVVRQQRRRWAGSAQDTAATRWAGRTGRGRATCQRLLPPALKAAGQAQHQGQWALPPKCSCLPSSAPCPQEEGRALASRSVVASDPGTRDSPHREAGT